MTGAEGAGHRDLDYNDFLRTDTDFVTNIQELERN